MESQRSLIKLWLVIVILLNFFSSLLFVIHFLSQFFGIRGFLAAFISAVKPQTKVCVLLLAEKNILKTVLDYLWFTLQ